MRPCSLILPLRPRFRVIPNASHLGSFFAVRSASSENEPQSRARRSHVLHTLLPERLLPGDWLDLSGYKIKFVLLKGEQQNTRIEYFRPQRGNLIKFPQATKGFFYFHRPEPHAPLLACSLRFRICESPDTFNSGSDLLLQDGKPWKKSMWWIIQIGWGDLLAKSRVISRKELDVCRPFATPGGIIIPTLLPEEFLSSDLLDLSGLDYPHVKLFTDDQEGAKLFYCNSRPHKNEFLNVKFPPQTKGFFYFHRPDLHAPLLACSIRFRICKSPDAFNTGKDLLLPDGSPWRKSFSWMVQHGWADLLAERNVISKTRLEKCRSFVSTYDFRHRSILVHAFHQKFPVMIRDSTTPRIYFNVLGEESAVPLTIRGLSAFRSYLKKRLGHDMEGDLTLKLHIEQDGVLRLSETASPPYDKFLQKGMAPRLYIARPIDSLPNENSDPVTYALDILREHEKRSLGAS